MVNYLNWDNVCKIHVCDTSLMYANKKKNQMLSKTFKNFKPIACRVIIFQKSNLEVNFDQQYGISSCD